MFKIEEKAYSAMLEYLFHLTEVNKMGNENEAHFMSQDFWLQDTAVIENIQGRNGLWDIYLVFAHHRKPLKLIKRKIVSFSNEKKAFLAGSIMRRLASKDQRGTLKLNVDSIKVNWN